MVEKIKSPTIRSQFMRASGMAGPVRKSDLRNKAQDRQNNTGKQQQRRSAGVTAPAFSCDRRCNPEREAARQGSCTSRDRIGIAVVLVGQAIVWVRCCRARRCRDLLIDAWM